MKNEKPFSGKRWTEIPDVVVVGHEELSEEEKKKYNEEFTKILKRRGIIKK